MKDRILSFAFVALLLALSTIAAQAQQPTKVALGSVLMPRQATQRSCGRAWVKRRGDAALPRQFLPYKPVRLPETYDGDEQDAWLLLVPRRKLISQR